MQTTITFETGHGSVEKHDRRTIVWCNEVAQIQSPDGTSITVESVKGGIYINLGKQNEAMFGDRDHRGLFIGPICSHLEDLSSMDTVRYLEKLGKSERGKVGHGTKS